MGFDWGYFLSLWPDIFRGSLMTLFAAGLGSAGAVLVGLGLALGLRRMQIARLVVLPQTLRLVAAPTANYMISLLKTTPYLAVVGVPEMLGVAFDKASDSFRYVEPLTAAGLLFLAYSIVIGGAVRLLERKVRPI